MSWVAAAIVGSAALNFVGSSMQADAIGGAANTQANAASQQQANLLASGKTAADQFTPYANYGTTALNNLTANNNYFNHQFNNTDLNANLSPNYAFGLDTGIRSQEQYNNATGGLNSGNAAVALQQYTTNYAQNAYKDAFNNYQVQRGNISAQNIAGANLGLSGATGSANAQLGTATNVANLGIGAANAQAAGQVGQAQAYSSGLSNLGNSAIGYGLLTNNAPTSYMNSSAIQSGSAGTGGFTATPGNSFTINPA